MSVHPADSADCSGATVRTTARSSRNRRPVPIATSRYQDAMMAPGTDNSDCRQPRLFLHSRARSPSLVK